MSTVNAFGFEFSRENHEYGLFEPLDIGQELASPELDLVEWSGEISWDPLPLLPVLWFCAALGVRGFACSGSGATSARGEGGIR